MLSIAFGFSGDMSHCSVLALEDPDFSLVFAAVMISKRFVKLCIKVSF